VESGGHFCALDGSKIASIGNSVGEFYKADFIVASGEVGEDAVIIEISN
jgi:Mn-containing catalase